MVAKVLIVDDEPEQSGFLARILTREGYEVAVAHNGRQGLRRASDFGPDLILLDVVMPGMDGWEMLGHLREFSSVPVIMLTAMGGIEDRVYGLDTGAFTPFLYAFRDREIILDIFEELCGARLTYNYMRIGGVAHDASPSLLQRVSEFVDYFEPWIQKLNNLFTYNKIFIERTANVAVIPAEIAISYGVTGPNLRASGFKWDLRKDDPYSIYDKLDFDF